MKNSLKIFLISLIPMFFVSFLTFTLAWNPPTEMPTGGLVQTHLSSSLVSQFKSGTLGVGGLFQAPALQLVPDGGAQPTCNESTRGTLWFEEGGSEEILFVCKWDGEDFLWFQLKL